MRSLTTIQRADMETMRPYENQGPTILGATLTVTILAVATTIARLYVRLRMIRNIGWDDYTMIMSMALCIAGQCLVVPEVYYGAGQHIEYVKPADFSIGMKLNFITQPIYLAGICMVKISVGFFLLRIAVRPMFRRLIISIMVFMGFYTFGCILTVLLQCTNIHMMWDPTAKGTCWTVTQIKILGYLNAALNMVTDLAFSIGIPIPMLWGVQMNRRHKASLICILGLGAFASAASMIKMSYIGNYGRAGDFMWDSRNLTIWTVQECNVGMVAGNLPCLKPLFRTILSSTYGKGSRKASQPQYLSGSYAAGTKERSTTKSYGPLASPKISDRGFFDGKDSDPLPHDALGKSYMLTTINAPHGGQANRDADTTSMSGRSSPAASMGGRSSTESFARLNNQYGRHDLGNIMVTTEVDVSEWVQGRDQERPGRPQAKEMV